MSTPRRKRIRLPADNYVVEGSIWAISIGVKGRHPIFADHSLAHKCRALLGNCSQVFQVPVYAYCLMPDHVHLLVGPGPTKGVIEFVKDYKSLATQLAWEHGYRGVVFQRSFYDHALRSEEGVEDAAMYILHNPVRAGLVERPQDYPYCGSFVFEGERGAGTESRPYGNGGHADASAWPRARKGTQNVGEQLCVLPGALTRRMAGP